MSLTRASKVPSAFCVPAILSPGAPPRSPSDQKAYSRDRETAGSREKDTHHNHPNRSQTKPDRGAGEARGGGQRRGQQKRQELGGRGRDPPAGGGRAREGPGPATIGSVDPRGHVRIPRHSELEESSTRKSKTLLLRVECHFFFGDFPPPPTPWPVLGGLGGKEGRWGVSPQNSCSQGQHLHSWTQEGRGRAESCPEPPSCWRGSPRAGLSFSNCQEVLSWGAVGAVPRTDVVVVVVGDIIPQK